jgi:NAD(P)-dependent dehydrogenase (short-subunit alcohol dehydrogenase family)
VGRDILPAFADDCRGETIDMTTLNDGRRRRLVIVALGAVTAGLAPAACDHPSPHRGSVDLIATLSDGAAAEVLSYRVSGNGIAPIAGSVQVPQPQQQFETLINFIPVGDDYDLDVTAASVDGVFKCQGTTKVSVHQNVTTRVHVALACTGTKDGKVVINVTVACPGLYLADVTVSPLAVAVGDTIAVLANASDADAGARTYEWSAPSGRFDDPSAARTIFHCESAGFVTLNLKVLADNGCAENHTIEVDCLGAPIDGAAAD